MTESVHHALQLAADRQPERVSPVTARAYRQDVRRLALQGQLPEDGAGCLSTYYRYVAACTYWAAHRVLALAGAAAGHTLTASERAEFETCAQMLRRYPPADPDLPPSRDPRRQRAQPPALPRRGHRSKNAVAGRLARSKREQNGAMLAAAVRQDIAPAAVALARITGAMPAEIEKGVKIQRLDDVLRITVWGAKVDADGRRGQPWRFCELGLDSPETRFLAGYVPRDGDVKVIRCSRRDLYDAVRAAAIAGLGRRLGQAVSPYVFRHRATCVMRRRLSRAQLACFRGDRSTGSAADYLGSGGSTQGPTVYLVDAQRAVRRHAYTMGPVLTLRADAGGPAPA